MNENTEVNLGDTVYWFEHSYPYVIQRGTVVAIERSERLVQNKLKTRVLRVRAKYSSVCQSMVLDKFYLSEKAAAAACRGCLEVERYYAQKKLENLDHALRSMDEIVKGKGTK